MEQSVGCFFLAVCCLWIEHLKKTKHADKEEHRTESIRVYLSKHQFHEQNCYICQTLCLLKNYKLVDIWLLNHYTKNNLRWEIFLA